MKSPAKASRRKGSKGTAKRKIPAYVMNRKKGEMTVNGSNSVRNRLEDTTMDYEALNKKVKKQGTQIVLSSLFFCKRI